MSETSTISIEDQKRTTKHVGQIVTDAFLYSSNTHKALVVFDTQTPMTRCLTTAYREVLPEAQFVDFDQHNKEGILKALEPLQEGDFAVLIQSTNFRLSDFRIRVDLFKRSVKVIEHLHLTRMVGEYATRYIDSLEYDKEYYHYTGHSLKQKIDRASQGTVDSGRTKLFFPSSFEEAKLNIGDYRGMTNVGGMYPIGEVFTEARDLESVHGAVEIFTYAGKDFTIDIPKEPILVYIEKGRVVKTENSTPEFEALLQKIREEEEEVWVRELGFGLNRAFTKTKTVPDVGTYERMCGVHLSFGKKHAVYNKPQYFRRKDTRYHVDVFAVVDGVYLDEERVFENGQWTV
jgi:hypothetical protein